MTSHLTYLMVQAQEDQLAARAGAPQPRVVRAGRHRPGRLRIGTARLLVALASRLDDRRQPPAARVAPSGARI